MILNTAGRFSSQTKCKSELRFPQVKKLLVNYLRECENRGQLFTSKQTKEKWYHFARLEKIPSKDWPTLGGGWCDAFKARHNLCKIKKHGEAASASPEVVAAERDPIRKITCEYKHCDVYTMDKTGRFYA